MQSTDVEWVRKFIGLSYEGYYRAIQKSSSERLNLPIKQTPPPDDGMVHASTLDRCAKKVAMEATKRTHSEFPVAVNQRMEVGTQMGHFFYESQVWGARGKPVQIQDEAYLLSNDPELPISGRPDVLIHYNGNIYPVEVKTTGSWKYGGIQLSYILQCIAYMKLLEMKGGRECQYGFVMTIYDSLDAPVPYRVWTIAHHDDKYILLDGKGEPVFLDKLPGNGFTSYVTETDFREGVKDRVEWMEAVRQGLNIVDEAPFETPFESWDCGRGKLPSRYVKTGEIKPTTGYWNVGCPAFKYCWKSRLENAGLNPEAPLPQPLLLDCPPDVRDPEREEAFFKALQDQSF